MLRLIAAALLALSLNAQEAAKFRLTVERQDASSEWREVNAALVFHSGDRLRFRVTPDSAGFLYVMNHGTSGKYELLFPRSRGAAENRIAAAKEYVVPSSPGWFKVAGPPGQDVMYWLLSPVDLRSDYKPVPPAPAKDAPAGMRPRCDDSILKARGECVDATAGVKRAAPGSGGDASGLVVYELHLSHE